MQRGSLGLLLLSLVLCAILPARAADELASLHYSDLYGIEQKVADLSDLKQLRLGLFVTSTRPGVAPQDIKMTMHRASGELVDIPVDPSGRIALPHSDALKSEDPLITTNQPRHSLNATVVIDILPLTRTDLSYAELILGVQQFNQAIDRQGVMASLFGSKGTGLLLFYNQPGHSLTLHEKGGDRVVKAETIPEAKRLGHMKTFRTDGLLPNLTVIYVPLDK